MQANPFPEHIQDIFLAELVRQASWTMHAAKGVDNARRGHRPADEIFRCLEALLYHASRISLILWPVKGRGDQARGHHLRQLLGVGENNPLEDRKARNHVQHFDERLDKWVRETGGKIYIDQNVGPYPPIKGANEKEIRRYDPITQEFIFRSEKYEIGALVKAVADLHGRALKLSNTKKGRRP